MKYQDYYQLMGVPRSAAQDEIKRAYRKLARKYHPDVSDEKDAEARFKEVNEAYDVLKDPKTRQAYDQLGANWKAGQDFTPSPEWKDAFDFGVNLGGSGAERFSDLFESLTGRRSQPRRRAANRPPINARGADQTAEVSVSLETVYQGASQTLTVQTAGGATRTLKVKFPKGVAEGQRIRLAEQGLPGPGGSRPGDLYLQVKIKPHPLYRTEGRDVYLDLPIAPWEAALGAKVTVPTLGGKVDLNIPAGSQSGQQMRLKGRGLPGTPTGDQYAVLRVVMPKADSEAKRSLFEQMRSEMDFDPRAELGRFRGSESKG